MPPRAGALDPLKAALLRLPVIRWRAQLRAVGEERDRLKQELEAARAEHAALRAAAGFVPPGHFYSPIPAWEELRADEARIFGEIPRSLPGMELREEEQLALLREFTAFYRELPFPKQSAPGFRYHFENPAFSYSDAILLHCMLRHLRPRRMIEVGSGYSSCMTLDTNERFLGGELDATFIEPHPELLRSLLAQGDEAKIRVIPSRLQDVALREFDALGAGDVLFIDSTHVSKFGSDVNRIVFEILPRLAAGVYVHFHDVFFPFEYPQKWIQQRRAWNELYLLRAFLQFNPNFRIVLMNSFAQRFHEPFFREHLPLCLERPGGSLWLRKE